MKSLAGGGRVEGDDFAIQDGDNFGFWQICCRLDLALGKILRSGEHLAHGIQSRNV